MGSRTRAEKALEFIAVNCVRAQEGLMAAQTPEKMKEANEWRLLSEAVERASARLVELLEALAMECSEPGEEEKKRQRLLVKAAWTGANVSTELGGP